MISFLPEYKRRTHSMESYQFFENRFYIEFSDKNISENAFRGFSFCTFAGIHFWAKCWSGISFITIWFLSFFSIRFLPLVAIRILPLVAIRILPLIAIRILPFVAIQLLPLVAIRLPFITILITICGRSVCKNIYYNFNTFFL